jgi:hypothetical protein
MAYKLKYRNIFEALKFKVVEELVKTVPVHDSGLRNSIVANVVGDKASGYSIEVYMKPYWKYIEFGSLPHWTSVDNLKKWAKDKLGDEDAAYALQHHIAKFGTKPNPFIRKMIDERLDNLFYEAIRDLGEDAIIQE